MTVGELKDVLSLYDNDSEIVFKPDNSDYVEDFSDTVRTKIVRCFYGSDDRSLVIMSDGQIGMI